MHFFFLNFLIGDINVTVSLFIFGLVDKGTEQKECNCLLHWPASYQVLTPSVLYYLGVTTSNTSFFWIVKSKLAGYNLGSAKNTTFRNIGIGTALGHLFSYHYSQARHYHI